ncbi:uncharacterized protein LOC141634006 [Silene latifolia]|uniref:uncharacterized protein LOC141634006 n=1 Tax=Silene latifolia TaxID=37657 RepID=UPI003D7858FB
MANGNKSFHPVYSVSNIKNFVPITLETENVHYASWAELFKNTARAFDVIAHIEPPKDTVINKDALWSRLDAIVKQWIYATISIDLLHTIIDADSSAEQAWTRLKDLFNDNQNARAVMLEQQFTNIRMDQYPNVSSYCQALKMIADQLANVGAPVSDTRLVLQLVTHVSDGYRGIATLIQQSDPLPSFHKARSMLTLEESTRSAQSNAGPDSALAVSHSDTNAAAEPKPPSNHGNNNQQNNYYRGKGGRNNNRSNNYKGKNNGNGNSHYNNNNNGRYNGNGNGRNNQQSSVQAPSGWTWVPISPWQAQPGWGTPPCPYPTTGWTQPNSRGILGPRPQQALLTQSPTTGMPQGALVPTDLAAVMQSLNLQQPDDMYYMDTGATSHMTGTNGPHDGGADNEKH